MVGVRSCVSYDPACSFDAKAGEHRVDFLRAGIVHVVGHAGGEDTCADDRPLAGYAAGNPFHISTVGPVDHDGLLRHI